MCPPEQRSYHLQYQNIEGILPTHSPCGLRFSFRHATGVAGLAVLGIICLPAAMFAQSRELNASSAPTIPRILSAAEAHGIIAAAQQHRQSRTNGSDCSHLVHEIYQRAGFAYPYAKSSDLYAGIEQFVWVKEPQRGDHAPQLGALRLGAFGQEPAEDVVHGPAGGERRSSMAARAPRATSVRERPARPGIARGAPQRPSLGDVLGSSVALTASEPRR